MSRNFKRTLGYLLLSLPFIGLAVILGWVSIKLMVQAFTAAVLTIGCVAGGVYLIHKR